jgi:histone H1/5
MAASAHPTYQDMVKAAVLALKDRTGSSVPAIAKFLGATYKLPANYKTTAPTTRHPRRQHSDKSGVSGD